MTRVLSRMFKVAIASTVLTIGVTMGHPDLGRSQGGPVSTEVLQITDEPLTITGELSPESEVLAEDGTYYNTHILSGEAGETLIIEMTSDEFDTYLLLLDPNGNVIAQNDDSGDGTTNSRIAIALPETGTYTLIANSYVAEVIGAYSLILRPSTTEDVNQATVLSEADQLNQQVLQLLQAGRYREGIPLAERALEIRETALGENHLLVAQSLNNLALLHQGEGNYAEAEPFYLRSISIHETALGENHPTVATSLNNLAELYRLQGNYAEAEPLFLRSISINQTTLGENHPDVATSLGNLALLHQAQGNYAEAEPLFLQALSIHEATLGENHLLVTESLNNLAGLYYVQGNYAEAEPLLERSLSIRETALGENHPNVATSLNNLAELYRFQGNYAKAEPLYLRSLSIYETTLGNTHPYVAASLNNLAELYRLQGNYAKAEPLYLRSLSIREAALGENHPDIAQSFNSLALLYQAQGNYTEAEPLFLRSLSIYKATLGENHPNIATSLNNLANIYQVQGNYAEAEPFYLSSLSIRRDALGETHPDVAQSLNNLALLYDIQGNYAEAEPLYLQSLSIYEIALGENHPDVASILNNLAELYRLQGKYAEAEPLYQRSLSIYETALGENHPDVASSLNNLALFYQNQDNYAEAEPLYLRSLSIRETTLGENHPDVASSLNNLASLYQNQGHYTEAEPLYLRSLSIYETALGENHPDVARSLNNLAWFNWASNQFADATARLHQGLIVEEANLDLILSTGSETRKQAYASTLWRRTQLPISFNLQATPNDPITTNLALETILRRKGRVLDAVTDSLQQLRQNLDPDSQVLLNDLQATRSQLVALRYQGPGDQPLEAYQSELKQLESQNEDLSNALAQRSAEFRVESAPVTITAIQIQIPDNAVLIEFFRYSSFNPTASQAEQWGDPRYAAYILHPDGTTHGIDLGEAEPIDQAITEYLTQLQRPGSLNAARTAGRTLDTLILQPTRPYLDSAQHLLISPDGQLNLIPFAALVDENDQYLIESYTLTTLASGRDLLKLQLDPPSQQHPVIVANPDFNTANSLVAQASDASNSRSTNTQRSTDLASLDFAPLPGTQIEADAIAPLLPNATLLTEADATEAALTQLNAPSILHLATHGYFLNDVTPIVPSSRSSDGTIEFAPTATPPVQEDIPLSNENPLLRSGLALANFNPPRDEPGNNDGVLSALEVSSLNLYGTDLVVLSACQTGVGDVVNGEGVYGLRRAFALAGAESLLMSLWKVDDYGTAELMRRYYERLINQNEGRSEALRQVQLELLNAPAYEHPYYWAAFMLSGDWRPLNK